MWVYINNYATILLFIYLLYYHIMYVNYIPLSLSLHSTPASVQAITSIFLRNLLSVTHTHF